MFDEMFEAAKFVDSFAHAKVVAFVTPHNKKSIISVGKNQKKTHPFQKRFSKNDDCIFLHAETDAIKNALKTLHTHSLDECDLYVLRLKQASRQGPTITGNCLPCPGCMRAIAEFDIRNVYYTADHSSEFSCL